MKTILCSLLLLAFVASAAYAQDYRITRYEREPNYLSFRLGTWFPKDQEKNFTWNNASFNSSKGTINQSQAIGLELQYQNIIAFPLYLDFSLGGWYSTYSFNYNQVLEDPNNTLRNADAWAALAPVTLGFTVHPLPRNPVQPYAMIGAGATFGFSGRTVNYLEPDITGNSSEKQHKNLVTFSWFAGAGFDFLFSPSLGASLGLKYNFVKFNEPLDTDQQDFTGLSISLGITVAQAYLD